VLDARRKLRVARQLNASALLLVSGPQSTHIRSHASRLMVDAMSQLCEAAADSPVRVAIQPMHRIFRKGWSFLHTLEESLALLDRVNSPKAGLCFGTYHLWQEPELSRTLPQIVDKIALVQLSDWREPPRCENDRTMLGDGCIPLKSIIASLESAGYCGWYEIEVWSRDLWKRKHVDLIQSCVNRYRQLQVSEASTSIAD
jgi:sugar phosphate isomerase/epimerase